MDASLLCLPPKIGPSIVRFSHYAIMAVNLRFSLGSPHVKSKSKVYVMEPNPAREKRRSAVTY